MRYPHELTETEREAAELYAAASTLAAKLEIYSPRAIEVARESLRKEDDGGPLRYVTMAFSRSLRS